MTGDGTKTYEWDAENRLTAVKQGGNTLASFTYDGDGRRATKVAGGVTISYVYDGLQFLEERPNPGTTKRYVNGPGIDQTLAQVLGGTTTYNVADHLGSIVRTTDSLGGPTLTRQYDPWGNPIQGSTTSGYAFTGRDWDAETSLYYYRARYYNPRIGAFLGEDPAGLEEGLNLLSYVANNPVNAIDPLGKYEARTRSKVFKRLIDDVVKQIREEAKKCKNCACREYFASHDVDLDVWLSEGGPPYVGHRTGLASNIYGYAQNGEPFLYFWLNEDKMLQDHTPCVWSSVALHEMGHLARKDTKDNEPQDFFDVCHMGCVEPGRVRG